MERKSIWLLRSMLAAIVMICQFSSVYAAGIKTFDLVGASFSDGTATATGTVTIDTTLGIFTSVNISVVDPSPSLGGTALFSTINGQSVFGPDYFFSSASAAGDMLVIEVPGTSLVGYTGSQVCHDLPYNCSSIGYVGFVGKGLNTFTAGSFVLSPVPVPPSGWLLASGLVLMLSKSHRRRSPNSVRG